MMSVIIAQCNPVGHLPKKYAWMQLHVEKVILDSYRKPLSACNNDADLSKCS